MRAARLGLLVLVALAATPVNAGAQDELEIATRLARFQLFNNCMPMNLVVERLSDDAASIGLTEERLQYAAESRLRGARLYDGNASSFLHIQVTVIRQGFGLYIAYMKPVVDVASGQLSLAPTWMVNATGTQDRDAEYIVSGVSQYLDRFLTEYLRANEAACER